MTRTGGLPSVGTAPVSCVRSVVAVSLHVMDINPHAMLLVLGRWWSHGDELG